MKDGDLENIQDRVISDARLLEILHEKDNEIYGLEQKLHKAESKLDRFVQLWSAVNETQ